MEIKIHRNIIVDPRKSLIEFWIRKVRAPKINKNKEHKVNHKIT